MSSTYGNATITITSFRDEESLNRIRQYIIDNPASWETDQENAMAVGVNNHSPQVPVWDPAQGQMTATGVGANNDSPQGDAP